MPPGRKRWQQLRRTLEGLRWTRAEALDRRGQVLDVVECELDDDELLDDVADVDARVVELTRRIVKIALDAQDKAVQRNTEHMKEALDSCVKVNRALAEQLTSTMKMYDAKLKLLDQLSENDDGESGLLSSEFIKQVPTLLQLAQAQQAQKANGK